MPDSRSLFRPEALEAQRQQWLGRVQLVRPLSLRVLTAGVVLVAASLVAFLSLAQYTRKSTAAGVLVPDRGLIRLVRRGGVHDIAVLEEDALGDVAEHGFDDSGDARLVNDREHLRQRRLAQVAAVLGGAFQGTVHRT